MRVFLKPSCGIIFCKVKIVSNKDLIFNGKTSKNTEFSGEV